MTFPTVELLILFAALSALVFKMVENLYKWGSTQYLHKRKLVKRIEKLIIEESKVIDAPYVFSTDKEAAMQRINTMVYIREIIDSL